MRLSAPCYALALAVACGACAAPAEEPAAEGAAAVKAVTPGATTQNGHAQTVALEVTFEDEAQRAVVDDRGATVTVHCGGALVGPSTVFTMRACLERTLPNGKPAKPVFRVSSPYPIRAVPTSVPCATGVPGCPSDGDRRRPLWSQKTRDAAAAWAGVTKAVDAVYVENANDGTPLSPFAALKLARPLGPLLAEKLGEAPGSYVEMSPYYCSVAKADGVLTDGVFFKDRWTSLIDRLFPKEGCAAGGDTVAMNATGKADRTLGQASDNAYTVALEQDDRGSLLYMTWCGDYETCAPRGPHGMQAFGLLASVDEPSSTATYALFASRIPALRDWYMKIEGADPGW